MIKETSWDEVVAFQEIWKHKEVHQKFVDLKQAVEVQNM